MPKCIDNRVLSIIYGCNCFICLLLWVFIQCGKTVRTSSQRLKIAMLNRLRSFFSRRCGKSSTSYLLYAGKFAQKTLIRHVSFYFTSVMIRFSPACIYTCVWRLHQDRSNGPSLGLDTSPTQTEDWTFSAPKNCWVCCCILTSRIKF